MLLFPVALLSTYVTGSLTAVKFHLQARRIAEISTEKEVDKEL